MRFRLRTLVLATAIGPPILAVMWFWGVPILLVFWILALMVLELGVQLGPYALLPLALLWTTAWALSLVAKLLIHVGTHPDNRR